MAVTPTIAPERADDAADVTVAAVVVPAAPAPAPAAGGTVRVAAVGLWVVVGTLLGYGVLQTALKAAALLG